MNLHSPSARQWYIARLLYRQAGDTAGGLGEQFCLIHADEPAWALEKAQVLGSLSKQVGLASAESRTGWEFYAVASVFEMGDLAAGAETFTDVRPYRGS